MLHQTCTKLAPNSHQTPTKLPPNVHQTSTKLPPNSHPWRKKLCVLCTSTALKDLGRPLHVCVRYVCLWVKGLGTVTMHVCLWVKGLGTATMCVCLKGLGAASHYSHHIQSTLPHSRQADGATETQKWIHSSHHLSHIDQQASQYHQPSGHARPAAPERQ